MTTLSVYKDDHSPKGLVAALLAGTIAASAAFVFPALTQSVSADINMLRTVVFAPKSSAVLNNQSVDYAGLMLFPSSNLGAVLK